MTGPGRADLLCLYLVEMKVAPLPEHLVKRGGRE
jgi:hypothetical protein